MREIKFRAWDGSEMLPNVVPFGADEILSVSPLSVDYRLDKVKAVMQYTGLKDKNGKEIYEGDIVHLENHKRNHKIIYTLGSFVGKQTKGKFQGYLDGMFFYRTEVIGNIYENKELLEG